MRVEKVHTYTHTHTQFNTNIQRILTCTHTYTRTHRKAPRGTRRYSCCVQVRSYQHQHSCSSRTLYPRPEPSPPPPGKPRILTDRIHFLSKRPAERTHCVSGRVQGGRCFRPKRVRGRRCGRGAHILSAEIVFPFSHRSQHQAAAPPVPNPQPPTPRAVAALDEETQRGVPTTVGASCLLFWICFILMYQERLYDWGEFSAG